MRPLGHHGAKQIANILITGATGLVGQATVACLRGQGHLLSGTCRSETRPPIAEYLPLTPTGEMDADTDWRQALAGAEMVVHLAARVHVMGESNAGALAAARRVNLQGSVRLAEQAAKIGVKRLIFASTVKVHGEANTDGPFTEADLPAPIDPYAISKWEAEQALQDIAARTGMELVVLRPPLIYGPGVKANFLALMAACAKGRHFPFGCIQNQRSLLFSGNFSDAIARSLDAPEAAGQTFLVRDDDDVSTPELATRLAQSLGTEPHLINIPVSGLKLAGLFTGRRGTIDRVVGSLSVDDSKIRRTLNWQPPYSTDRGLAATTAWYLQSQNTRP